MSSAKQFASNHRSLRVGLCEGTRLLIAILGAAIGIFLPVKLPATELHDAVNADDLTLTSRLISEGADPNELDGFGSPLGIAISKRSLPMVELLLRNGADLQSIELGGL